MLVMPTPGQPKAAVGVLARGYAAVVVSLRLLIIAGWVAAVGAAIVFLPPLNPTTGGLSELIPPGSPAAHAEADASKLFGFPLDAAVAVVQRNPHGLPTATQVRAVRQALAEIGLPGGARRGRRQQAVRLPARRRRGRRAAESAWPADGDAGPGGPPGAGRRPAGGQPAGSALPGRRVRGGGRGAGQGRRPEHRRADRAAQPGPARWHRRPGRRVLA